MQVLQRAEDHGTLLMPAAAAPKQHCLLAKAALTTQAVVSNPPEGFWLWLSGQSVGGCLREGVHG